MGKEYAEIDESMMRWMKKQHLFFVATAPRSDDGLINCSPKGLDGLRVLGPNKLVYADTGGSGIETVAHLKENGRILIMMCAFEGPPKIFRFYGTGSAVEESSDEFGEYAALFPDLPAIRNFIVIDVERIRDACGYGVPNYEYVGERDSLKNWLDTMSPEDIDAYRKEKNAESLDGLPGLDLRESH